MDILIVLFYGTSSHTAVINCVKQTIDTKLQNCFIPMVRPMVYLHSWLLTFSRAILIISRLHKKCRDRVDTPQRNKGPHLHTEADVLLFQAVWFQFEMSF